MVEFKNSVSFAAIQSKFPTVDDRAKVQGFGKLAFAVTSVRDVAASLKSKTPQILRQTVQFLSSQAGEPLGYLVDFYGQTI